MQPVSVPTSLLIFKDLRVRGFWMSRDGALPTVEVCAPRSARVPQLLQFQPFVIVPRVKR